MSQATNAPTLESLRAHREEILRVAAAHDAYNVQVFGSVARGEADERSDIDLLVEMRTTSDGWYYFGRLDELEKALAALLGRSVSIVDTSSLALRPYNPEDKVASIDAAA